MTRGTGSLCSHLINGARVLLHPARDRVRPARGLMAYTMLDRSLSPRPLLLPDSCEMAAPFERLQALVTTFVELSHKEPLHDLSVPSLSSVHNSIDSSPSDVDLSESEDPSTWDEDHDEELQLEDDGVFNSDAVPHSVRNATSSVASRL
jgi:hypothetical protein